MKSKKELYKIGFELLIVLVTITVATFAWFFDGSILSNDDFKITTKAISDLLVSADGGQTWQRDITLNLPPEFIFGKEISGNGINFYSPVVKRPDGTPLTFKQAESGKDYLEAEVRFKSSANVMVFLGKNSKIEPAAGVTNDDLLGWNVERKSSSGNFSRDLIAGAVRVAFIENELIDGVYTPKGHTSLVWAPNKSYEIDCSGSLNCLVDLASNKQQNYKYVDANDQAYYTEKDVANLKDELNVDFERKMSYGDPIITHIKATDTTNDISSVTIRIWIEGNDREATTALTGGMFKMELNFVGLNKQINSLEPNVVKEGNTIIGYTDEMEYSTDLGNTYFEVLPTSFDNGATVYIRYKETDDVLVSNYKIIKF